MEKKLCTIGHIDPDDVFSRLAEAAVRPTDLPVTDRPLDHIGRPSAGPANVHLGEVAEGEESLVEVGSGAMGEEAIALHFPKLDPTEPLAVSHGLAGERVNRTCVPEFHLVLCHVDQALIERRADEYHGAHELACMTIYHSLAAPPLEVQTEMTTMD